jgi:hypothetical protein
VPLSRRRGRGEPKGELQPQPTPNAIVAAASRLNRAYSAYGAARMPKAEWQAEAWRQAEINGELKFAATWMANSLSRCRMLVADVDENDKIVSETKNEEVQAIVKGLVGSPGRMAEMLNNLAMNLFLPGDCYVIAEPGPDGSFSNWYVVSIDEISSVGVNQVAIDRGDGLPYYLDVDSNLIIRIWHRNSRKGWEADSPTRSALPVLREIEEYGRYINAVISSRLAGAGIMGVPSEMNFPTPPEGLQPGETPFMAYLAKSMLTPISDLSDPSAVVPIVIEAPADALEKIVWIVNPQGDLTEVPALLRDSAISRLSVALDLPADVVKGTASSNHWGQWALEEQAIKLHIEPLMILICSSLTEGFLRPALEAAGIDPARYTLWFDSSDLVLRPDRGQDAKDNYDRGTISAEALNRETGFTELDRPTGDEKVLKDLLKLVSLSPTAADALLPAIAKLMGLERYGVDLEALKEIASPTPDPGGTPPQERAPDPNEGERDLPTMPRRQEPNAGTERPGPAVVASAVEEPSRLIKMSIHNALCRAGAMMSGRKAELKDTPKHEVHVALGGISAQDANRILAGQFDYLAGLTDDQTAIGAEKLAYDLLVQGRPL